MAFKIIDSSPNIPSIECDAFDEQSTIGIGSLLYADQTDGKLRPACLDAGSALNVVVSPMQYLVGISRSTVLAASLGTSATISYTPLIDGQFVIADCNADTSTLQLFKCHRLTNCDKVNNSSTSATDSLGVFFALKRVGATDDKKLYGYIRRGGSYEVA